MLNDMALERDVNAINKTVVGQFCHNIPRATLENRAISTTELVKIPHDLFTLSSPDLELVIYFRSNVCPIPRRKVRGCSCAELGTKNIKLDA